jgi:uncharacterized protein DUF5666
VAGAATTHTGQPPAAHGPGAHGRGAPPTAGGKITALSGDAITVATRNSTSETITYTDATTFKTRSGTTTAADLKVGELITVQGTKAASGDVNATAIMISTGPPGQPSGGKPGHGGPPNGRPGRGSVPAE